MIIDERIPHPVEKGRGTRKSFSNSISPLWQDTGCRGKVREIRQIDRMTAENVIPFEISNPSGKRFCRCQSVILICQPCLPIGRFFFHAQLS